MSVSFMSVVKPVRQMLEPEDAAPRLSQELPSQAIGPCTRWATSVNGCSAILAPSKAQPPAAPPGCSCFVQPFLRSASVLFAFLPQPGSLKTSWIVAVSELICLSSQPRWCQDQREHQPKPCRLHRRPRLLPGRRWSSFSSSTDDVEAVVGLGGNVGVLVDLVEDLVEDLHQHVHAALIAPNRIAVMVVAIEDREADPDQRRPGIALEIFAVRVADQEIHRLGEEQRTHVPEVLARIGMAVRAERRAREQR